MRGAYMSCTNILLALNIVVHNFEKTPSLLPTYNHNLLEVFLRESYKSVHQKAERARDHTMLSSTYQNLPWKGSQQPLHILSSHSHPSQQQLASPGRGRIPVIAISRMESCLSSLLTPHIHPESGLQIETHAWPLLLCWTCRRTQLWRRAQELAVRIALRKEGPVDGGK